MASPAEPASWSEWARSVEPWVLPALAAVVVAGVLLLCILVGMFWLASRPTQQPVVIWLLPTAAGATNTEPVITNHPNLAVENQVHAPAN